MRRITFLRPLFIAAFLPLLVLFAAGGQDSARAQANDRAPRDPAPIEYRFLRTAHDPDTEGHIDKNVNYGLRPVSDFAPLGVQDGRYTDVWAHGNYAYVGSFSDPACDRSGVSIIDISDPTNPQLVSHIPSPPNTQVNDVKTVDVSSRQFQGTVLIHTQEPCGMIIPGLGANPSIVGQGGVSLYDVTDPTQPHALKLNFLPFGVHNTFPWTDASGNAYVMLVDDVNFRDVHILDITKPQSPRLISSTGLPDWPAAQDAQAAGMGAVAASFNHDIWVQEIGGQTMAVVSYWDAGFVLLDVTDPANPVFVGDSTYPDPDPINGFSPPEGNAHAAVFDATGDFVYAGDEDFDPFRLVPEITSGPFTGETFNVSQGSDVPLVDDANPLIGPTVFAGLACGSAPTPPGAGYIAIIERGACAFTTKAQTVQSLGYEAGIVFNSETGDPPCEASVNMLAVADIPFLFVARSSGYKILGVSGYDPGNCPGGPNPALPTPGTAGSDISITGEFDGFSYFHLLDRASLAELGYYSPAEVFDHDYAEGFGDLSMHNVEGDPDSADADRAYVAWYSLGMRVLEMDDGFSVGPPGGDADAATPAVDDYYGSNVREVGRFIAEDGSNFWGVHVFDHPDGEQYILASDRNTGLWIFEYDPSYCDPSCP